MTVSDQVTADSHSDEVVADAHERPGAGPMVTVPVHSVGQSPAAARQSIHVTFPVSTVLNPVQQILGRDYDRTEARVMTTGPNPEPVILAQSKEIAENAAAQGAAFTGPAGSWLPASTDRPVLAGDELWCAATSATTTLVSVIICRRLPVEGPAAQ